VRRTSQNSGGLGEKAVQVFGNLQYLNFKQNRFVVLWFGCLFVTVDSSVFDLGNTHTTTIPQNEITEINLPARSLATEIANEIPRVYLKYTCGWQTAALYLVILLKIPSHVF